MRFTFKNIFPRMNFGNRPLVFTLAFLLVFSLGSYALAAGLYHPGDTNDPTCSPGDAGCYVDVVPDQTGHTGYFLMTDGTNLSWSASIPGSGIATINADPSSAQTLTTGTSGMDFNIQDDLSGGHVFNIPTASLANRGLLSTADYLGFSTKLSTVSVNGPLSGAGTSGSPLSIPLATDATDGYLSHTDRATFNGKLSPTLASGKIFIGNGSNVATARDLTLSGTAGTFGLSNTGVLTMPDAATGVRGLLNGTDWDTFNSKLHSTNVGIDAQLLLGVTSDDPHFATLAGDATITNTGTITIGTGAVTYAKMQNMPASTLLGNPTGSSASPTAITLGSGLSFTGSVLDVTATPLSFSSPLSNTLGTVSIADAVANGTTKGAATFAASDFNSSSGVISIDYAGGQAASATTKGFLTLDDWTTFNNKLSSVNDLNWSGAQLSVSHGGTGATSFTTNGLLLGNGTSALSSIAAGTDNQLLMGISSGAPIFKTLGGDATVNSSTGNLTLATTGVSGSSCTLCNLSYDTKGRITAAGGATSGDVTTLLTYTPLNPANNLSDVANANTALNNLLPTQTTSAHKFLQTDGLDTSWVSAIAGTLSATQVAFGLSENTATGSNDFTYDDTLGLFNVAFGGSTNSYLKIDHGNRTYQIGDTNSVEGGTLLSVNDRNKIVRSTGYSSVHGVTGCTGTCTTTGTIGGTYTGTTSTTFTLTIDGTNAQSIRYSSGSGTFLVGETVTGSLSSASGTVQSVSGVTIVVDGITGTFITGEIITGATSSAAGTTAVVSAKSDTVSFVDGAGTNSYHHVIALASMTFSYGMSATLSLTYGTTLGDHWDQTVTTGLHDGLSLNFASQSYRLGSGGGYVDVNSANGLVTIYGNSGSSCTFNGAPGSVCLSDGRLKKNVTDLADVLPQIGKLRPVTYNWISPSTSQSVNTGFIAQEVQEIFPQYVGPVGDGTYLGVNYQGFIVPAIKAIQELDIKLQTLSSIDVTKDGSIASLITTFLKDAVVSIKEATIGTLHIEDKVCADDVCVTKEQFKNLLMQAGGTSTPAPQAPQTPDVPPTTPETPAADPTPPAQDSAPSVTPDVVPPTPDTSTPSGGGDATQGTTPTTPTAPEATQ